MKAAEDCRPTLGPRPERVRLRPPPAVRDEDLLARVDELFQALDRGADQTRQILVA